MSDEIPTTEKRSLARLGVNMLLKMVFRDDYFHADLHPGNMLVVDGGEALAVLDVGIAASLNEGRDIVRDTFKAVVQGDGDRVGELFLDASPNE